MIMEKGEIRKVILQKRLALSDGEVNSLSEKITQYALGMEQIKNAGTIAAYIPFANEADTSAIIAGLWESGKHVCVPVVEGENMRFAKLTPLTQLKKNLSGIAQPCVPEFIEHSKIDLFLVPGIAFAKNGERIGTGKGFYDRFFGLNKIGALKIGMCFGFQIVAKIPHEMHDVKMDFIITEHGIIAKSK